MSGPVFIRLTLKKTSDCWNWRKAPWFTPRSGFGLSKSGAAFGRWTAPPKGAAEFVGRDRTTVVLDLSRWLERKFEGLADGGPLGGRPRRGLRLAQPKNHP